MKLRPTVASVINDHVTLELESIDRLYLNIFVPQLQREGGLAILIGFQTRLAAIALFGFCVIDPSIFWLDNLENLSRDYATAGGFLFLIVFGPGPISLDAKFGRNGRDLVSNRFAQILDNQLLMERLTLFGRVLIATPFLPMRSKRSSTQTRAKHSSRSVVFLLPSTMG